MTQHRFRAIDPAIAHQALIVGRVTDGLTNRPTLRPPAVELTYQTPPGQPARSYPLDVRLDSSGVFAFAGMPGTAFPRLSPGGTLDLRLTVSAPRYQTQNIDFTLADTDLAFVARTLDVDGESLSASVLDAPLREENVALLPEPVHLGGRVVNADDPETPVANAQITITAPEVRGPVSTNADGFFTLQDLPVAQEVTVHVSGLPGFEEIVTIVHLDYRQPVNRVTFALEPD